MRIGISGYGKMGELIHQMAAEKGHQVACVLDPTKVGPKITGRELLPADLPLDVIIDFTEPGTVISNIERYADLKVAAVIGTTGWYAEMERAAAAVKRSGIGLIWSGNFSLGVNLFFKLAEAAGEIFNRFEDYDASIHEHHHRHKIDSPSGTAQMLGDILLSALKRKEKAVTERLDQRINEEELHISSTRGGSVPGVHRIIFDSDEDTITLEHSARSRSGFAAGALLAAEWIKGRSGLYHIDDMMQSIIGGGRDRSHI